MEMPCPPRTRCPVHQKKGKRLPRSPWTEASRSKTLVVRRPPPAAKSDTPPAGKTKPPPAAGEGNEALEQSKPPGGPATASGVNGNPPSAPQLKLNPELGRLLMPAMLVAELGS